jgi:ubiquinone/menaquinone biosynthesis C-methylase UbiE
MAELAFWESRVRQQGVLANDHYEHFYTSHFGLTKTFYRGKRVLDIGCGPRGSLEWTADALCVGADPLAVAYRRLGTAHHDMRYIACDAEALPFGDGSFDVVSAFNSLDHVDDLAAAAAEISRVVALGGVFLLLVDIHEQPTTLEPSACGWDVVDRFRPALALVEQRQLEYMVFSAEGYGDIYQSLWRGVEYDHDDPTERYGILSARFTKLRLS